MLTALLVIVALQTAALYLLFKGVSEQFRRSVFLRKMITGTGSIKELVEFMEQAQARGLTSERLGKGN
jgi:hypothetical protein